MHESLLARAALPSPTVCLGLLLRPFSLGHLVWLEREQPDILSASPRLRVSASAAAALPAAVLICCQGWQENSRTVHDRLLPLKLSLWRWRVRRAAAKAEDRRRKIEDSSRRAARSAPAPSISHLPSSISYLEQQLQIFRAYIAEGSLQFKPSDTPRATSSHATPRLPGAPFPLVLQQWLMTDLRLTESQAWDYPFGLAKMRWAAHWEQQGGLDLYNEHDAEFDRFIAEQEAKGKAEIEKAESRNLSGRPA